MELNQIAATLKQDCDSQKTLYVKDLKGNFETISTQCENMEKSYKEFKPLLNKLRNAQSYEKDTAERKKTLIKARDYIRALITQHNTITECILSELKSQPAKLEQINKKFSQQYFGNDAKKLVKQLNKDYIKVKSEIERLSQIQSPDNKR